MRVGDKKQRVFCDDMCYEEWYERCGSKCFNKGLKTGPSEKGLYIGKCFEFQRWNILALNGNFRPSSSWSAIKPRALWNFYEGCYWRYKVCNNIFKGNYDFQTIILSGSLYYRVNRKLLLWGECLIEYG